MRKVPAFALCLAASAGAGLGIYEIAASKLNNQEWIEQQSAEVEACAEQLLWYGQNLRHAVPTDCDEFKSVFKASSSEVPENTPYGTEYYNLPPADAFLDQQIHEIENKVESGKTIALLLAAIGAITVALVVHEGSRGYWTKVV